MSFSEEFITICQRYNISEDHDYLNALERHARATIESAKLLQELLLTEQSPATMYRNSEKE